MFLVCRDLSLPRLFNIGDVKNSGSQAKVTKVCNFTFWLLLYPYFSFEGEKKYRGKNVEIKFVFRAPPSCRIVECQGCPIVLTLRGFVE